MGKTERVSATGKHNGEVTCVLVDKGYVYSGGADGIIKVWDKNLKLVKDIQAHKEYILAMAVNNHDQLYSAGRDGTLRFFKNPFKSNVNEVLMQVVTEDITALWVVDDLLFSGDDKGTVTKWLHNRNQVITIHSESHTKVSQYNIIEEVKSMIVENDILYTARDLDAVVTNITPGMMSCSTRAVIAGRAPLALVGPKVDGHRKFLVCITRDGKGITLIRNTKPFDIFWTKENAHEWIINAICTTEDAIYTAAFDGKVKKWANLDTSAGPKLVGEVDTDKCLNCICNGPSNTVYVGDADGNVKQISF